VAPPLVPVPLDDPPPGPIQPVATVGEKAGDLADDYPDGTPKLFDDWHENAWCAEFVGYVWGQAGADTQGLDAGAASFVEGYAESHPGTLHEDAGYTPQVGDAVVYDYSPDNAPPRAAHVAIITAVDPDGAVTIENGNWGNVTHEETVYNFRVGSQNTGGQNVTAFVSPVAPGGIPLAEVEDHGVVSGPDQQPVAVADPSAITTGGDPVVTGSSSVRVGRHKAPLARHGDRTANGGAIVDQTHENVYAGG
jgi:hypothetical protein